MQISHATIEDAEAIVSLLNSAYRGEPSRQGWTTEANLIAGDVRTDAASVQKVLQTNGSVILKCCDDDGNMVGTVNLQQHGPKMYLGMFAVSPQLQGKGIGKQLLEAAEIHTRNAGCVAIYMHVVSVRTELIEWYKRHGYRDTGERKPFHEDGLTGRHLQPLEFAVLEKEV
ncbi:MAG: GNAT family N-acetyltransferase [Chitinophagaceae bacterium]|nr:GNAT family N-acetyltransferase [Chitinophagaceae bacterium]